MVLGTPITFGQMPINLYPWNITSSVFYTAGQYSTGTDYRSVAGYFSMDRKWQDRFTVSLEQITITDPTAEYRQQNILGRDFFYIRPWLVLGGIAGWFQVDPLKEDLPDEDFYLSGSTNPDGTNFRSVYYENSGWITGFQITGDLPRFGYAVSYIASWYDFIERYENHVVFFNDMPDLTFRTRSLYPLDFDQLSLTFSRMVGKHIFRLGGTLQNFTDTRYQSVHGIWEWSPVENVYSTLSMGAGDSRYTVEPFALLINNNPDILKGYLSWNLTVRASTHWYLVGSVSTHRYKQTEGITYHAEYAALGIRFRF